MKKSVLFSLFSFVLLLSSCMPGLKSDKANYEAGGEWKRPDILNDELFPLLTASAKELGYAVGAQNIDEGRIIFEYKTSGAASSSYTAKISFTLTATAIKYHIILGGDESYGTKAQADKLLAEFSETMKKINKKNNPEG